MLFPKKFLHRPLSILNISVSRLLIGLLLGLGYSFVFYSFLYLSREIIRVLSVISNYNFYVLNDSEIEFYNLFFGFISALLGQSVLFQFLLERPGKYSVLGKRHRFTILNDQRIPIWYFLSWFAKLAIAYGTIFVMGMEGGADVFSFFPNYKYLFILIIVVLFFQSWNSFKLIFKRKSYKWMFVSFLGISAVAGGLSQINWVNHEAINEIGLKNNVSHHHQLKLPTATYSDYIWNKSQVISVYMARSKNELENNLIYYLEDQQLNLSQLEVEIIDLIKDQDEYYRYYLTIQLFIDRSIKMKDVNKLGDLLVRRGIYKAYYSTLPEKIGYDASFSRTTGIYQRFIYWEDIAGGPQMYLEHLKLLAEPSNVNIHQKANGQLLVDQKEISEAQLIEKIKAKTHKNMEGAFVYYVNDEIEYQDYIKVLDIYHQLITDLRNDKSLELYQTEFDNLNVEEVNEIEKMFPIRLITMNSAVLKRIKQRSLGPSKSPFYKSANPNLY